MTLGLKRCEMESAVVSGRIDCSPVASRPFVPHLHVHVLLCDSEYLHLKPFVFLGCVRACDSAMMTYGFALSFGNNFKF